MKTSETKTATSEAAILSRVLLNGQPDLPPELARYFLGLRFGEEDKARMHDLALRNQQGTLREGEAEELDGYRRAGYFLDLLRSKARLALKKHGR